MDTADSLPQRVTLKMDQRRRLWNELESMGRNPWSLNAKALAETLSVKLGFTVTPTIAKNARRAAVPKPSAQRQPWWRRLIDRVCS